MILFQILIVSLLGETNLDVVLVVETNSGFRIGFEIGAEIKKKCKRNRK